MRIPPWLIGLTTLVLSAGCAATARPDTGAAAHIAVPADLKSAGVLRVGSDLIYAPMESVEGGKPVGFDVDRAGAIAKRLGLRLDYTQVGFDNLLDAVNVGKIDMAMSSMTDKASRQEKVDFVDYLNVGTSIVIRAGVPAVNGLSGLCGRSVAVQTATMYVDFTQDTAKRCPAGAAMRVAVVNEPSEEVRAGRADAYLDDFPIAARQDRRLARTGRFGRAGRGRAVRHRAVQAAS
jgi:polar amino acid transport system substrate-binding protein